MHTAVVFIVFNRPDTTARVFSAIREARPPRLFIIADGPRSDRPDDASRCVLVRKMMDQGVDWPCVVEKNYSDTNLGCGRRVASGLDWVFDQVAEAIVLEDDCLPDATFFPFCEELLARYRDNESIAQIAGCSFLPANLGNEQSSYYFSMYPHCWGWATWRRAWRHYDYDMNNWRRGGGQRWLKKHISSADERRWWFHNFSMTCKGRLDTWDFRWALVVFMKGWRCILPYRNLVTNIGFNADATHTHEIDAYGGGIPLAQMCFPLRHPNTNQLDMLADKHSSNALFRRAPLWRRAGAKIRRLMFAYICPSQWIKTQKNARSEISENGG